MEKMERLTVRATILILLLILSGCAGTQNADDSLSQCSDGTCTAPTLTDSELNIVVDKLEIYHFHGTHQCYSCKTVGEYARETVETYFADELDSGKIVFGHINAELPENLELAQKYGVTSSSLWLGVYDNEGFHPEQNDNVWYKISNKDEYMQYLKGLMEMRLAGDFS